MSEKNNIRNEMVNIIDGVFYNKIIEQARDIILVVRMDGNLQYVNHAASEAYGYSIEELQHFRIHDLRAPDTRVEVDAQLRIAQQDGSLFRTLHMRRTGEYFPVEVSSQCVRFSDEKMIVSVVRDITQAVALETSLKKSEESLRVFNEEIAMQHEELTASEEELRQQFDELLVHEDTIRHQNSILTSLHETAMGLMQRLDTNNVLRTIISSATDLLGTTHGYISLVDKDNSISSRKIGLGYFAQDVGRDIKLTEGLVGQVYKTGKIMVIDDYSTWEYRLSGSFFDKLHQTIEVPLKSGNMVIGVFGLAFLTQRPTIGDQEIYLLQRFADLASIALNNAMLLTSYKNELLDRRQAEENLKASEAKYRTLFEVVNDGFFIHELETGKILDVNEKGCELYGYTKAEILTGNLKVISTGEQPYSESEALQYIMSATAGVPQLFEWENKHKDGHVVWAEINLKRVVIDKKDRILAITRDISERKVHEQVILRMVYYDSLTGLSNRRWLQERLVQEIEKAQRGEAAGAVLFIDIDNLKMINDTLGHSYGDYVIKEAGACILAESGKESVVSRIGGDEFVVLLPYESNREKVAFIADGLVKVLSRDYQIGESSIHMTASIGVALYPLHGDTAENIFKNADLALYASKGSGKNTWRFYEASLEKITYNEMMLKRDLRYAIEQGELSLQYQPMVDPRNNNVVCFEALLRWTSIVHGSVPPSRFIPLAEESDIIIKIGKWVIEEACRFARKLADMGKNNIRISVNVSSRQLVTNDFVKFVHATIKSARINPNQLEIEITESALITSLEDSVYKLKELRAIGVHLSLDDFGTGYSSLNYLKSLPMETLKIDKSFIDQIKKDKIQLQFISSIINMAHVLGMTVVAEGVETEEQLEKLMECHCDLIQGYIFSKPVSEKKAILFLEQFRENIVS